MLSGSNNFFANLKSDGFSDLFGFEFGFSFCCGKHMFIICHNPLLASKQIHIEQLFTYISTD